MQQALRHSYADLRRMEEVVLDSDLDWTIIRPARLTGGSLIGHYRTVLNDSVRGGWSFSRADLAESMLRRLDDPATVRAIVSIAY